MAAKKISIINFKGGVGKTTISFHFACFLARTSRVLIVDVDHQSSLSITTLDPARWEDCVRDGSTVNQIFRSLASRNVPMPGQEIIFKKGMVPSSGGGYPNLDLVPAQFELDETEIDLASTFIGNPTESDWEKRTLLAAWLDKILVEERYDYIIFDCPPATKIVSQNALACSDGYIVPVIPDEISTRGVTHFVGLVKNKLDARLEYLKNAAQVTTPPNNYVPKTKLAAIVPYLAKTSGNAASKMTSIHTKQISDLRQRWGDSVLNSVVKNYIGIAEAMNRGWPVWDIDSKNATANVCKAMESVCEELKQRIDAL